MAIIHEMTKLFKEGGPFMWVILAVFAFAVAVVIERVIFYLYCFSDARISAAKVAGELDRKEFAKARSVVRRRTPANELLKIVIDGFEKDAKVADIQEAVEMGAIAQVPRLTQRLSYIALLANMSTLLGLLGTILGLQISFGSMGNVDASQKAAMLSQGIAEAMNCTAFGLLVAIGCMAMNTILSNRSQSLTRQLDEGVVRLLAHIRKNKGE